MDRSYLSDQDLVAASRAFVCVRLLTYESAEEAELIQRVFRGRDGLENSVFAILDPTGERKLVRAGRSPSWAYEDAAAMTEAMADIAERYPGKKQPKPVGLPVLADVRRGLNVARADDQLLAIVYGEGDELDQLETSLAELAWSDDLIGKLLYARAEEGTDWESLDGSDDRPESGVLIVEADEFGVRGKVVKQLESEDVTAEALLEAVAAHRPAQVDTRQLRRKGKREGVEWKTAIPVTDRGGRRR